MVAAVDLSNLLKILGNLLAWAFNIAVGTVLVLIALGGILSFLTWIFRGLFTGNWESDDNGWIAIGCCIVVPAFLYAVFWLGFHFDIIKW